jgi:imidazolonepropionase-like amidohydrolase
VIRPGAYADILIAEGDPTRSLEFLTDPAATLKLIMKDGRVHKNTMQ